MSARQREPFFYLFIRNVRFVTAEPSEKRIQQYRADPADYLTVETGFRTTGEI